MGDLVLKGATSGQITVTPTAIAGTNTLTLPAATGNIITSADSGTVTTGMLASGAITRGILPVGTILQVVNSSVLTTQSTTSTTYVDTSLSAAITPTSSANKILILVSHSGLYTDNALGAGRSVATRLLRDSNQLIVISAEGSYINSNVGLITSDSVGYLDSPATTSSITYKTQFKSSAGQTVSISRSNSASSITLLEIAT